jgi:hypothetical protein
VAQVQCEAGNPLRCATPTAVADLFQSSWSPHTFFPAHLLQSPQSCDLILPSASCECLVGHEQIKPNSPSAHFFCRSMFDMCPVCVTMQFVAVTHAAGTTFSVARYDSKGELRPMSRSHIWAWAAVIGFGTVTPWASAQVATKQPPSPGKTPPVPSKTSAVPGKTPPLPSKTPPVPSKTLPVAGKYVPNEGIQKPVKPVLPPVPPSLPQLKPLPPSMATPK